MSLLANLIKEAKLGVKTTSKSRPFVSAVDKAAMALPRPKGTGKEFMTELKKTKGVKPIEIEDRKLAQIEALPKMTKEQFLDELDKRPPVDVSESELKFTPPTERAKNEAAFDRYSLPYQYLRPHQREVVDELLSSEGPKYSKYQFPKGENYREILLHLPSFGDDWRIMELEAKQRHGSLTPEMGKELEQLRQEKASYGQEYQSPHWGDKPNVLAHMRVSDRLDPEGKKILHVEEIQSDWHQEGRKKGYKTGKDYSKEFKQYQKELLDKYGFNSEDRNLAGVYSDLSGNATPEEMNRLYELQGLVHAEKEGLPDAPFKKNWHELAMKRLINYAAENGYDEIAITPGAEQAKRYDLSKHISKVRYFDEPDSESGVLHAYDLKGNNVLNQRMSRSELEQHIGKDATKKLMDQQIEKNERTGYPSQQRTLSGLDLQVGGEGMQGFYDKMLPDYLNQFGKPYGAQVELGGRKLLGDSSKRADASERLGLAGQRFDQMTPEEIEAFNANLDEANAVRLHSFPITPQMRESINTEKLPLYQQIGIPLGAGTAGSQVEMPQQQPVAEPVEEPAYAMGGAVYDTTPDMSDGGRIIQGDAFKRGGKVHIADNPDTMFMELHDRMFKRK